MPRRGRTFFCETDVGFQGQASGRGTCGGLPGDSPCLSNRCAAAARQGWLRSWLYLLIGLLPARTALHPVREKGCYVSVWSPRPVDCSSPWLLHACRNCCNWRALPISQQNRWLSALLSREQLAVAQYASRAGTPVSCRSTTPGPPARARSSSSLSSIYLGGALIARAPPAVPPWAPSSGPPTARRLPSRPILTTPPPGQSAPMLWPSGWPSALSHRGASVPASRIRLAKRLLAQAGGPHPHPRPTSPGSRAMQNVGSRLPIRQWISQAPPTRAVLAGKVHPQASVLARTQLADRLRGIGSCIGWRGTSGLSWCIPLQAVHPAQEGRIERAGFERVEA